jgi:hypothetical protein
MPFIGNKPSAVPLTSADITDGIIVNADISSTAGITLNKISGNPNFRNIVINGDMQIAQRSTSVASITTSGYYTLDRFKFFNTTLGTWTMSQSTDVPSGYGFANSLKLDCTTADASPASADNLRIQQIFEGQNLQYLKKGTANAVSLTASFWVKSTKTGTFICELVDLDNSRSVSQSYTVSVTNTWEFKTVTFPGDTTGAFGNDNGDSLSLNFWLGAGTDFTSGTLATTWVSTTNANRAVGQVNIADNTANDFLITGVQLEAGTSATDFEFLPIDVDLMRCYRYYYQTVSSESIGISISATQAAFKAKLPVTMRATPALTMPTSGSYRGDVLNGGKTSATAPVSANPTTADVYWYSLGYTGASAGELIYWTGTTIKIDAEL